MCVCVCVCVGVVEKSTRGQQVAAEEQSVLGTGPDRLDVDTAPDGRGQTQSGQRVERRQSV